MKRLIVVICTFMIIFVGCRENEQQSIDNITTETNISDEADKTITVPKDDTKQGSESNSVIEFTEEEIESAKQVAEAYYGDTSFDFDSIEFDLENGVFKQYKTEFDCDEENVIGFTVEISDSENPPRGIVLIREDVNGEWAVATEGY